MNKNNFWSRHRAAKDAGLNDEWALKVAYGCIELDAALGGMNHQSESDAAVILAVDPVSKKEYDCGCRGSASCRECIPF